MQAMPVMVGETACTLPSTCQPRVVAVSFTDQAGKVCCADSDCACDDAQCGAGGECITSALGSRCYKGCTADSQCRDGYTCAQRGTGDTAAKVCLPTATSAGAAADASVADGG